jgi:hypothetical protein
MDQNLGINKAEQGEDAFHLLFDWYTSTLRALVDAAGQDRAIELLAPYHKNAFVAAYFIVHDFYKLGEKSQLTWFFVTWNTLLFMLRSPDVYVDIYSNGGMARVDRCLFENGPVEHCILVCAKGPSISLEAYGIEMRTNLVSSISQGDKECKWITKKRSSKDPYSEEGLGFHLCSIMPWDVPKLQVDAFSIQYCAEWWVIATRALIDLLGEGEAVSAVVPYLKRSGISQGQRMSSSQDGQNPKENIARLIIEVNTWLQIQFADNTEDHFERTIVDCPFKEAPTAVCKQFEAFCNGICEAIDPSYEFVYDRMMTNGDERCHWTIKKRSKTMEGSANSMQTEDPTKALGLRLARGEISLEEFERLLDALKKHGVIK